MQWFYLSAYQRYKSSVCSVLLCIGLKIYFYDNGIRNALIANFSQIENRTDLGALWKNFLISERMKSNHYNGKWCNSWFWHTTKGQEVDYIEEEDCKISAYEFKWNEKVKTKQPKLFLGTYENSNFSVIHKENFEDFLL